MSDDVFQSPLLEMHQAHPLAELTAFGPVQMVLTFGEPQAEYAAVRKACGLMDQPQRGLLELSGKDRHAFLGNLISNKTWDIASKKAMNPGQGVYAFFLNLKGRVVADLNVLERGDRTLIESDARLVPLLRAIFDRYLFSEQVTMKDLRATHTQLALMGPGAAEILRETAGADAETLPALGSVEAVLGDSPLVVWRDDSVVGAPGFGLIVRREAAHKIWHQLLERFGATDDARDYGKRRLRPIGWAVFNTCRIEAGRPILGIDYEPAEPSTPGKKKEPEAEAAAPSRGVLPVETGLIDKAVDFTKGCYLGQEIVARMHARKQIARKIAGFRMAGEALPIAGAGVFDAQGMQVGIVTSSTVSPVLSNAAIGLALLKKPHFELGAEINIAAEGAIRPARVVPTPFVAAAE